MNGFAKLLHFRVILCLEEKANVSTLGKKKIGEGAGEPVLYHPELVSGSITSYQGVLTPVFIQAYNSFTARGGS